MIRRGVTLLMILGVIANQVAVSHYHVHAGMCVETARQHNARPHFHLGDGHDHGHGHLHDQGPDSVCSHGHHAGVHHWPEEPSRGAEADREWDARTQESDRIDPVHNAVEIAAASASAGLKKHASGEIADCAQLHHDSTAVYVMHLAALSSLSRREASSDKDGSNVVVACWISAASDVGWSEPTDEALDAPNDHPDQSDRYLVLLHLLI